MSKTLFDFFLSEASKPFSGWDFSYLENRMVSAPLEWSYPSIILQILRGENPPKSLLDMGTGGGEFFSKLRPFPPYTCVTEGYEPNLPLARARLEPLGVQVFSVEDDLQLPFANHQFEMIINRHESYAPAEVYRILEPGGLFITQQVGDQNDKELVELLGAPTQEDDAPWNLDFAVNQLTEAGFELLEARECFPATRIFDAGALVYYFKAIPWEISDFSVEKYLDALVRVHETILEQGYIEVRSHRFLIRARRPDKSFVFTHQE